MKALSPTLEARAHRDRKQGFERLLDLLLVQHSNLQPNRYERQSIGYQLVIERGLRGDERLAFTPIAADPIAARLRKRGLNVRPGENL